MEQVLEEENKMLRMDTADRKQIIIDNNTTIGKFLAYVAGVDCFCICDEMS